MAQSPMPLARKRRIRVLHNWSQDIGDLHDYVQAPPQRACVGKAGTEIAAFYDWPDQVPIGDTELRVSTSKQAESDLSIPTSVTRSRVTACHAAGRSRIHSLNRVIRPPMIADLHSRR